MKRVTGGARRCGHWVAVVSTCSLVLVVANGAANSAGCALEPQGEGRVVEIIDRAPSAWLTAATRTSALSAILAGRDVTLRGEDDTPDRYGRQPAFVFLAPSETLVQ